MEKIKFSHNYNKLHGQKVAELIRAQTTTEYFLSEEFIEYDTAYSGGNHPLPGGPVILLLFVGEKGIPFTTIRSFKKSNLDKVEFYKNCVGKLFKLEVSND